MCELDLNFLEKCTRNWSPRLVLPLQPVRCWWESWAWSLGWPVRAPHPDLLPTEEVTRWRAPKVMGLACSGAGCDLNIVTGGHVPIFKSRSCEVWSAWPCLFLDL